MKTNMMKKQIGRNIARLRASRSRSWLARSVGTYPINITRIEAGENMPGVGLLLRIAAVLDSTVEAIISAPQKKIRKRT